MPSLLFRSVCETPFSSIRFYELFTNQKVKFKRIANVDSLIQTFIAVVVP